MWAMLNRVDPEIDLTTAILGRPGVMAAFVLFCALFGVGVWLLADSLGWSKLPAVLSAVGLSLAVAVTLVRSGGHWPSAGVNPISLCLHDRFSLHGGKQILNFAMLMPFAFFATLATRRPIWTLVASAVVSGGIEITQAWTGLGICQGQDFLNNTIGAAIAIGVAWLIMVLVRNGRRPRQPEHQEYQPLQRV
jgi:hypothetical protein